MCRRLFLAAGIICNVAFAKIDERAFLSDRIITKDVAIIGGGASGTYSAVRLREDLNIPIIVIEPKPRLGGHVDTYTVPETNTTLEYGVQSYIRIGGAVDFFKRFGIDIVPFTSRRLVTINADIETGRNLTDYVPPSNNATNEAFQRWLALVEQYNSFIEPGYWNFPEPDDIPSDLLLPFAEFARTYKLEAAVPRVMAISNAGVGGIEDILALHIMQLFSASITKGVIGGSLFIPVGSNSLLYQRAYELLKSDVLLSTTVKEVERHDTGAKIVVRNSDGEYLIKAKKVLYSPQPSLQNLEPFDLDEQEKEVFKTWTATSSYVGVAKIPCIPENYSVSYLPSVAVPSNYLASRNWPYTLRLDSTGPSGLGLFRILFGANYTISEGEVKLVIEEDVRKLFEMKTIDGGQACKVDFKAFSNHSELRWEHSVEQLKKGFIQKLYALQGHKSTWYTGYIWSPPYSSNVWAFAETILARLLEDL